MEKDNGGCFGMNIIRRNRRVCRREPKERGLQAASTQPLFKRGGSQGVTAWMEQKVAKGAKKF